MKEFNGDIWHFARDNNADAVVITTNGFVKNDGKAVMGRGIALEATKLMPTIQTKLGSSLKQYGNLPFRYLADEVGMPYDIITLPVKHVWWDNADLKLIASSIKYLLHIVDFNYYEFVVMPRPGSGNGKLSWDVVKSVIEPSLDDRFWVGHK